MRVSDFIAKRLQFLGCKKVYMVTGGAAMHLNDSFGSVFKDNVHFMHHEQSCSIAAESYARLTLNPAIVNVTAGPGAINAINGVFGAFVDSIPMIIISGQAKRETLVKNSGRPNLRQLGDQEVDIISMVKKICKKSILLEDPNSICDIIDELFIICTSGRKGPVWLDVPIDVQATPLNAKFDNILGSSIHQNKSTINLLNQFKNDAEISDEDIEIISDKLLSSNRPTIYVGNGVRLSESYEEFLEFLQEWEIATVTGWNNNDLLWDDHRSYVGRPGSVGNRAGNFAVQLSDFVLIIGCRLNIRQVSFNWQSFAKNAWTCHVDIDLDELEKPTLNTNLKIQGDIKNFFNRLSKSVHSKINSNKYKNKKIIWKNWILFNKDLLSEFPATLPCKKINNQLINPYYFIDILFKNLSPNKTVVCADGTACVVAFQAAIIKKGQRLFHNSGCASMGYEIPASIGAFHAENDEIICIAGDGSIMMNLQELAIIGNKKMPIKIFLLNNNGYHSIRQTQKNYFPDNLVGCGIESGLPFPDFKNLAKGFSLDYKKSFSEEILQEDIKDTLSNQGPIIHEIILNLEQTFEPKLSSKKLEDGSMSTSELEDMAPFISDQRMREIKNSAFEI